jgi:hypothetical protein
MSVKDLINKAYEKDAAGFEEMFASIMDERMENAIANKYDDMFGEAKNYDDEDDDEDDDLDEECEPLDELSDRTLASYANKASNDFRDRKKRLESGKGTTSDLKKAQRRRQGANRAVDTLSKRRFGDNS